MIVLSWIATALFSAQEAELQYEPHDELPSKSAEIAYFFVEDGVWFSISHLLGQSPQTFEACFKINEERVCDLYSIDANLSLFPSIVAERLDCGYQIDVQFFVDGRASTGFYYFDSQIFRSYLELSDAMENAGCF